MKKEAVFRASAFVFLLTLCLLPGSAHAANVTVGCVGGSGTYPTIGAALTAIGPIWSQHHYDHRHVQRERIPL